MKNTLKLALIFSLSIFALACGDDHDHDEHDHEHDHDGHTEETIEAEACEHMAEGPATAITAGATEAEATDTTGSDWEHKRVDITLNDDGAGAFTGYVTYEADEDAEFVFFTNGEFAIQIDGVDAESTSAVAECTDVVNGLVFDLSVGEHVVFISASSETVSIVAEEAGGDHSDHSDG